MNLCKTCKYWSVNSAWRDKVQGSRCDHPDMGEGAHRGKDLNKDIYMTYSYDEGGVMEPSANFGCVLHEEKNSDN